MNRTEQRSTTPKPSTAMPSPPSQPSHLYGDLPPLGEITVPDGLFLPGIDASDVYALRLIGRTLEPLARSGEHAIVSPARPYEPGDFVVLAFVDLDRGPIIRRLVMPSPIPVGEQHPHSNVAGNIVVELLAEKMMQQFDTRQLTAVHRVVGFLKHDGSMAELPQPERARRRS